MNIISERVGILAYQRIEAPSPTNNKCAFNTNENCKQRCMRCKSKIVNTSKRRFMTFQGCPIARLYVKWGDKPVRNWSILYKIDQVNRTTSIYRANMQTPVLRRRMFKLLYNSSFYVRFHNC